MAVFSGRNGQVFWDSTGAGTTFTQIASLSNWKLSSKTPKINVTVFGATNMQYVPGMRDMDGSFAGFWDSTETSYWDATTANTPGMLKLVPDSTVALKYWKGKAYLDASIDVPVEGAPAITSTIIAAGPWSGPTQTSMLTVEGASAAEIADLEARLAALRRAA